MLRLLFILSVLLLTAPLAAQPVPSSGAAAGSALEQFRLPADGVTFIENRGQWSAEVAFLARLGGVDVWVTADGLTYDFYDVETDSEGARSGRRGQVLRASFLGGQASRVEGRRSQPAYHHYVRGDDPARWATFVPLYEEVVLIDVYEDISLRLFVTEGVFKHEWVVASSADPSAVQVDVEGSEGIDTTEATFFDRATVLGLSEQAPDLSFRPASARSEASGDLRGEARLRYARYLGGVFADRVRAVAVDGDGAMYLGGRTTSFNFPTPNGFDSALSGLGDAFVAQIDTDGSQPYGTFLGGSSDEEVRGVAYANESAYVTGVTVSTDFPTTPGAYDEDGSEEGDADAFVSRLRLDDSGLVFSTYLGGNGDDEDDDDADNVLGGGADDVGSAVAVTATGMVVVGGRTFSDDFPVSNGSYAGEGDAFVVVLNADGSDVLGGTYLGGSGLDEARALVLDGENTYVAGDTDSDDFGGLSGSFSGGVDAYVARISSTGTVVGGTYVGGSGLEGAEGLAPDQRTGAIALAVDENDTLYISGDTTSDDLPAATNLGPLGGTDAFVSRLNPPANGITRTTIFGGSDIDRPRGMAIASDGTIHLAGETTSDDFPVANADDDAYGGQGDAFVIQLSSEGDDVLYGTYLGASNADAAFDLAVGADGFTYLAGETRSGIDFPVTATSPLYGGLGDAFAASYDLTINVPPVVISPLADTSLVVDGPLFTADLTPVFDDPDGDPLVFSCESSDSDVASVGDCSDGTISVTAVSVGTATITVTADDGSASVSDDFMVTVTDNLPPEVVDPPDDATLVLGEDVLALDLTAVFTDPEDDPLVYGCQSSDPGVATVGDCSDGALDVTPASAGAATVTVSATDPFNPSASTDFVVTVEEPNAPPTVVSPIDDLTLTLGDAPFTVDLATVFEDADGDALSFACSSSAPGVAVVGGCTTGTLSVTPASAGSATVTVTASDPEGSSAQDVFVVTVVNPPPVVSNPIDDVALTLGDDPVVIVLDEVFDDPNGDVLAFECESNDTAVATTSGCAEGTLTVTAAGSGTATITVTADDGDGSVADEFVVTVADNLPPVVADAPEDATLVLGEDVLALDLTAVFADPEDDPLVYGCQSSDPGVATVGDCSDGALDVTPASAGTATITVTAADPFNPSASADFVVTVEEPNAPPTVVSPIDDLTLTLGDAPFTVDLATVFEDADGDALSFACSSSAPGVAVVGGCTTGTLSVTPASAGSATVTVTASDPEGASAQDVFAVTVVNPPPVVSNPIEDLTLDLGSDPFSVNLNDVFDDPNNEELTFGCVSSDEAVASVSDCADDVLTVTPESAGSATVTVTATDPAGADASDVFVVTVVNPPPVVASPIPDRALLLGGAPFAVDLDTVFVDPNGDALSYSFGVDASTVLLALDGSVLIVTPNALGATTVTVTASDGAGSVSEAFVVTVTNNLPPEVIDPPDDATIVLNDPPLVVDLSAVFDDPEGDALTFSCESSDPEVASVGDCSDGSLEVSPVSVGEAMITASATDGNNASVPVDFLVTVETDDPPPVVVSPIDDVALALGDAPFTVDLATVFEDPAGDDLTFECVSSDEAVASVSDCADDVLTVTPESAGSATVTVTATDPAGADASDVFVVTVVNPPPVVASPIPDRALLLGGAPFAVDLDTVFVDPNGDALSYSFGVDASTVLLALDGSVLIVTPNALGATTVTVTASDGVGSVSEAFVVTVTNNLPPEVVDPPEDATLTVGDDPLTLDLRPVFSDPEGDGLSFDCESSDATVASVGNCLDGTLEVTPESAGEATITVSATDPFNPSVSADFVVTVVEGNAAPIVVNPIDDATLSLGSPPLVIDLTAVFEDPNDDVLTFECLSSDTSAASVSGCLSSTSLRVTAEASGMATITVTATDPEGAEVSDTFVVTVVSNAPPVVENPIDDISLALEDAPFVVDLSVVFSDPEGGELVYACFTTDTSVVTVSGCAEGTLTASARGEGMATITVTATDPEGAESSDAFLVTVVSNAPPVVSNPLMDVSLALGDAPLVVDLSVVFSDPEGGELAFDCETSDATVVAVTGCAEGTLTATPAGEGTATVTITATDPAGASAEDAFVATVGCEPATIESVVPSPADPEQGSEVVVTASTVGATAATLRYRASGAESFQSTTMTTDPSSGDFVAAIPGSAVTSQGVEYLVEARSACGAGTQSAGASLRVQVPTGIASPALPAATAQTGYRLVSVPLDLEEEEAAAVLGDFGPANDEAWRLFELLPPGVTGDRQAAGTDDQWYREDVSAIAVAPGEAYWLIVRDGGSFNTGAGTTLPSDEPFTLDLHRGWNLVGTPFGHEIPLDRARTESGAPLQLQAYDGAWSNVTDRLRPFQGYAFRLDAEDRLIIEPPPFDASVTARPSVVDTKETGTARHDEASWAVTIIATVGRIRDDNNAARVTPGASDGRDASDWYEPPPIGEFLSVAFTPPAGVAAPLTVDARPVSDDGATWPVIVRSNLEGRIDLTFDGLDGVPDEFVVWLVDDASTTVRDLRRDPAYAIVSHGTGTPARLRLVIGTEDYAQRTSGFDGTMPTDFHLAPSYPNPFRTAATIQYALPRAEHVEIEVFDITGRRVATLVDQFVEAGYHTVVWDGRSGGQAELASGVYIYRLRAGAFTATQRAVLVR